MVSMPPHSIYKSDIPPIMLNSASCSPLFRTWIDHLPNGTSLWQYPPNTGLTETPQLVACNTPWETLSNETATLTQLNERLVLTNGDVFTKWLMGQPLTGDGQHSYTTAQLHLNDTVEQIRLKVKCVSFKQADTLFLVLSLLPLCEDALLGEAHRDFLSVLSHEFRTPLTSIQGFADTLLQFGGSLPPEQQRRCLTMISEQTKRLNRMVENLLSASKLEAHAGTATAQAKPVVLGVLLEKVLQTIAGKSHAPHQVNIQLPKQLPPLWGNPDTLEQILLNLIDNAFKYSAANTTVTIVANLTSTDGQEPQTCLTITDEGIGLSPEQQEQLFTKFYRASNPLTQNVEGTGLGLYITKVLVQQLGGTIKIAHSSLNHGTCFELYLPIATTQRIQQKTPLLLQNTDSSVYDQTTTVGTHHHGET
jgi:signal transduction histidine kinase